MGFFVVKGHINIIKSQYFNRWNESGIQWLQNKRKALNIGS